MRFKWLVKHFSISQSMGSSKICRTLVCTITTAGPCTCKMTQKTCVARHICDFYFLATFFDLILTFSGMTFALSQYHSHTFSSTLCEFELFATHLTNHTAQNVKTMFFIFDLTLTLT